MVAMTEKANNLLLQMRIKTIHENANNIIKRTNSIKEKTYELNQTKVDTILREIRTIQAQTQNLKEEVKLCRLLAK